MFGGSIIITVIALTAAFMWGGVTGLAVAAILGVMEVSLSFDNAVVNATVLQRMDAKWQRRFLTWGMVIAVFGMRIVFPLVIVSVISGLGILSVGQMALNNPVEYSRHLTSSHIAISAFGGMFLLLVFLSFLLDAEKEVHWLGFIEEKMSTSGRLASIEIILAMGLLLGIQSYLPTAVRLEALVAGLAGIILYVLISSLSDLFDDPSTGDAVAGGVKQAGLMSFLYLEVLDASFSFDGVIGAFAITKDVVIIALGLAIGAMFVRSLTIYLVRRGTLQEFIYLEHGAHYGIGALAAFMLVSMSVHVPEVITGLCGVAFIGLSVWSSIRHNRREAAAESAAESKPPSHIER
ncbi:MAG: DUF475 domain-containing protein [Candidatus Sericytochromatia bacterium]|nr:DUF475 domain-containing protein [Candidatus Sericytochromatia bacterium]